MSAPKENDPVPPVAAGESCRVLVADDDETTRRALTRLLIGWGYEVLAAAEGEAAWEALRGAEPPQLALLDWVMPKLDGLELCRRVREEIAEPPYMILLTGRCSRDDIVAGLDAGADEYLLKPIDPEELRARVRAGRRLVDLRTRLAERVRELEAALARERRLQGLLPICAWCRKVRNDQNYWQAVEEYFGEHAAVRFTHGICPACLRSIRGSTPPPEPPPEEGP